MLLPGAHQSLTPRSTARYLAKPALDSALEVLAVVGIVIRIVLPLFAWGGLQSALPGHGAILGRPADADSWSTLLVPASALLLGALGFLVARWPRSVRQRVWSRADSARRVFRQSGRVLRLLALECAWLLALCEWVAVTDPIGASRLAFTVGVAALVVLVALTPILWTAHLARGQAQSR